MTYKEKPRTTKDKIQNSKEMLDNFVILPEEMVKEFNEFLLCCKTSLITQTVNEGRDKHKHILLIKHLENNSFDLIFKDPEKYVGLTRETVISMKKWERSLDLNSNLHLGGSKYSSRLNDDMYFSVNYNPNSGKLKLLKWQSRYQKLEDYKYPELKALEKIFDHLKAVLRFKSESNLKALDLNVPQSDIPRIREGLQKMSYQLFEMSSLQSNYQDWYNANPRD